MKKNMIKGLLTVAMVATMFIGGNKLTANAMTIEEFSQFTGLPVEVIMSDPAMVAMYEDVKNEDASVWLGGADPVVTPVATTTVATTAGVPVSHQEMLALVNADRTANGAGNLTWNADLEAYCISRLPVAMNNFHSVEYANARAAGDYAAKSAIGHSGAYERENLAWTGGSFGTDTAERHNTRWIESTGHHNSRITAGLTQYACASYVDPVTGDEVWIEAFK